MKTEFETQNASAVVVTPEALLEHWQGHRRLTRKTIEAFPEDKLFTYSIGSMRPFAELAIEMIQMATPSIKGIVTGQWKKFEETMNKAELLALWDTVTVELNDLWKQIPIERFQEEDLAFGQYQGTMQWLIFYVIDNEIHHRAQGYVYLRSLGITPPFFWER